MGGELDASAIARVVGFMGTVAVSKGLETQALQQLEELCCRFLLLLMRLPPSSLAWGAVGAGTPEPCTPAPPPASGYSEIAGSAAMAGRWASRALPLLFPWFHLLHVF